MWLKIADGRPCAKCHTPTEHWVLYGQTGQIVVEATFCPICYPDVTGIFEKSEAPQHKEEPFNSLLHLNR